MISNVKMNFISKNTSQVTVKEQQEWKIPPCISNWKNPRGYTIPLDKRLAADGRGLQVRYFIVIQNCQD